jgi:hypothetical protein
MSDLCSRCSLTPDVLFLMGASWHLQAQEKEPRLPQLLRLLLWAQGQLDSKATYPRITDLASGQLELPKPE